MATLDIRDRHHWLITPQAIQPGTYYLRNVLRNKDSLAVERHADKPFICCGAGPYSDDQLWTLSPAGDGFTITNMENKKVLGIVDGQLVGLVGLKDVWNFNPVGTQGAYEIRHADLAINLVSWATTTGIHERGPWEDQHWWRCRILGTRLDY